MPVKVQVIFYTPYGASTVAGRRGQRLPSANKLAIAKAQGKHATEVAARLVRK